MNICPFAPEHREALTRMLASYFKDDLHEDWPAKAFGRISDLIIRQYEQGIVGILLPTVHGVPVGFSVYQIDKPESDWCKRPGWGFIREFYIQKEYRRQGMGTALVKETEKQLIEQKTSHIYLTTDDAKGFWLRCGYEPDHTSAADNMAVMIKKT